MRLGGTRSGAWLENCVQFEGAFCHVINRGNYRRDLFETLGAAESFLVALFEAVGRFGWRLHSYILMRNHFHLALETPKPNVVDGMHWLQSSVARRFNRFGQERGHLFQAAIRSSWREIRPSRNARDWKACPAVGPWERVGGDARSPKNMPTCGSILAWNARTPGTCKMPPGGASLPSGSTLWAEDTRICERVR